MQHFVRNSPMEALALLAVTPFAAQFVRNAAKMALRGGAQRGEELEEVELEEVRLRGKTFLSTVAKGEDNKVDLGWWGASRYFVPVLLLTLETFGIARNGAEHFTRKGFTPAQRAKFQMWLFFGLLPLADMVVGADWKNPSKRQARDDRRLAWRFRLPLYLWCATAVALNIATFKVAFGRNSLQARSRLALFGNLALLNGVFGINISHELLHKQSTFERILGNMLLVFVNYVHWGQEHLDGHHDHVATPLDPATARKGENVYAFLPRSVVGSFLSSCRLEAKRLETEGTPWYSLNNRILQGVGVSFAWSLVLARAAGTVKAIPAFYTQALVAASLLEVVNYMEHYGLERRLLEDGKYEPVDPRHSWNAPNLISNTVLFKLQRHSDHHAFASRPYEILRNFVESPQLPTGYPGMYILSLVPPLFFSVMDPLVEAHRLTYGTNGQEPTREELELAESIKSRSQFKMWSITVAQFVVASWILVST